MRAPVIIEPSTTRLSTISDSTIRLGGNERVRVVDGPDVPPVIREGKSHDLLLADRVGNDLLAEIGFLFVLQQLAQNLGLENIDAHGSEVTVLDHFLALRLEKTRRSLETINHRGIFRLFHELGHQAVGFGLEQPQPRGLFSFDRINPQGDFGPALPVEAHHLGIIHPVEVVTAEDHDLVRFVIHGVVQRGPHRVAGALEPVALFGSLLGGQDVHESIGEHVEGVGLHDVPVQAGGSKA